MQRQLLLPDVEVLEQSGLDELGAIDQLRWESVESVGKSGKLVTYV